VNPSSRATLLILDRSVDVLAPLVHEFTYQAMVYDLLDVDAQDHYKYNALTTGGENKTKEILLGETDPLWPTIRHLHIADTINWILEGFNDFVKENKAAKFSKKEKVNDLKEMSEAMKQMPQYQEMLGKVFFRNGDKSNNLFSTLFTSIWQTNV
jgi:syntaxin-binding protein 1